MWKGITLTVISYISCALGCRLLIGKDIDNADLGNSPGQLEDCCGICSKTPGCKAFSWTDYLNGTCWLKAANCPLRDGVQVTFGVLDEYETACVGTYNPDAIFNQSLDFLIDFLVVFVIVSNILGVLLEALVISFLCKQYKAWDKNFCSPYFILLNYGYLMDLVMFSPFWIYKKFSRADNFMTNMFNAVEWYAYLWYSCWNMMLALNRATAILFPFNYNQIWSIPRTIIIIIIITILPLIINIESYTEFWQLMRGHPTFYDQYKYALLMRNLIASIFSGIVVIASTISSVSLTTSNAAPKSLIYAERRLIIQSIVSSALLFLQYTLYFLAIYLPTIPNGVVDWHNRWALFTAGDALYMIQHFASIGIILIVSYQFRCSFIKFIFCNTIDLERPHRNVMIR